MEGVTECTARVLCASLSRLGTRRDAYSLREEAVDDVATERLDGVYCPAMPCSAAETLRDRRAELVSWLTARLAVLASSTIDLNSIVDCHRSLVATCSEVESRANVSFSWFYPKQRVREGPVVSFEYVRKAVGVYAESLSLYSSTKSPCRRCIEHRGGACEFLLEDLASYFPDIEGLGCTFELPDLHSFTEEQMAAWSIAVMCVTLGLLGHVLDCPDISRRCQRHLETWEPILIDVLFNGRGRVMNYGEERAVTPPPAYESVCSGTGMASVEPRRI